MEFSLKQIANKIEINLRTNEVIIHLKTKYYNKIDHIIQSNFVDLNGWKKAKFYLYKDGIYIRK